ncbi:hypothetical protein J3R30DRAFT_3480621 [Lentinula aciculospora]|uniref:Promethin n=1 Tax=Lentinula aciculospora TaxID=153920 RepID=A0A9W9DMU7_9AGAR|nr:hypothetical protein J3R30DRAFT_3480621 [Lentinula aciculospora]
MSASQQDRLSSHFEQSRADVNEYATWIEQQYARPAFQKMQWYYQRQPLLSAFATVFILLGLPPVVIYIGLCLFALTLLLLSALCVVAVVSATIALALGSILLVVLLTNLLLSIFITLSLGAAYLSYKIIIAGYTGGISGARLQLLEFYTAFFSRVQKTNRKFTSPAAGEGKPEGTIDESPSSSPNSTVIVDVDNSESLANIEDRSAEMNLEEQY